MIMSTWSCHSVSTLHGESFYKHSGENLWYREVYLLALAMDQRDLVRKAIVFDDLPCCVDDPGTLDPIYVPCTRLPNNDSLSGRKRPPLWFRETTLSAAPTDWNGVTEFGRQVLDYGAVP